MRNPDHEVTDPGVPGGVHKGARALVLRDVSPRPFPGAERDAAPVLEVHQLWGDLLVDTRHFSTERGRVTVGGGLGWRWSVLGVDLGRVPDGLRHLARLAPPLLSDVDQVPRCDFHAGDLDEHTLFELDAGGVVALLDPTWDAHLHGPDGDVPLDALLDDGRATRSDDGVRLPLPDSTRLVVRADGATFVAGLVRPGARVVQPPPRDLGFAGLAAVVALVGALFGLLAANTPEPPRSEAVAIPDRFVALVLQAPSFPPPPEAPMADAASGERAPGEEGRAGEEDATLQEARGARTLERRHRDREIVAGAGVLGALDELGGPSGDFGSGLDDELAESIGGLRGPRGARIGDGGFGDRGDGPGGGGEDTEGTSFGDGPRGPGGPGSDLGGLEKRDGAPVTLPTDPLVVGALPRSVIDEIVKNHLQAIRYCYQRELQRASDLAGRLSVRFTIAGDGSVSSARVGDGSLAHEGVRSCVSGRFLRMRFPEPRGGGLVVVTYPLVFSPR